MKKKLIFIIGTVLIIIITILLLWYNGVIIFNYPSEKRYEVRGVDVSSYQGERTGPQVLCPAGRHGEKSGTSCP